jgi:hypothetical protein
MGAAAASDSVLHRLTSSLRDPVSDVRSSAARALSQMGAAGATLQVLASLLDRLRDNVPPVRAEAVKALATFLRVGIRWFRHGRRKMSINTVEKLSHEPAPARG